MPYATGLKRFTYAILTDDASIGATYESTVALPEAVVLGLSQV